MLHVSYNVSSDLSTCYLRVPFQLSSPPGFHVTHISKGNLVFMEVYVENLRIIIEERFP